MDVLGSIGKLYTFILLVVLFLGTGLAVWAAINAILNKKEKIKESTDNINTTLNSGIQSLKNKNVLGGINMKNSGFIKLAVFSFVGIIISAAILAALPNYSGTSMNSMNMGTQYSNTSMNMQGMSGNSMQAGTSTNSDLYSIQQQLNQIQQQIYQLQNQMNNGSMSGMQNNSSNNMNNNSMNSNSMNNNSNSMNSNSNNMNNSNSSNSSSSMSSMPMM